MIYLVRPAGFEPAAPGCEARPSIPFPARMLFFSNLCVYLQNRLCGDRSVASAQFLAFLDLAGKISSWLAKAAEQRSSGYNIEKDLVLPRKSLITLVRPAGFEPAALDAKPGPLSLFQPGCSFSAISASICKIACAATAWSPPRNFLLSLTLQVKYHPGLQKPLSNAHLDIIRKDLVLPRKPLITWYARQDSNLRPTDSKSGALSS